ncbi:hypothetical protein M3Y97_00177700 [Aphelenchoides bicaudatus]|nr:hypothetical protein M3Y97_00177700 [Aphelenchoides bicaudatus]
MNEIKIEPGESVEAENFEPWDPIYRCCCGSVHVKQGALIIGTLTGIIIMYSLFVIFVKLELDNAWNWAQIILLFVDLLAVLLLIYGIMTERHRFLLPYLIYSFHTIMLLAFGLGLGLYCWVWPAKAKEWFPMDMLFERTDWRTTTFREEDKAVRMAAIFISICCLFSLIPWMLVCVCSLEVLSLFAH